MTGRNTAGGPAADTSAQQGADAASRGRAGSAENAETAAVGEAPVRAAHASGPGAEPCGADGVAGADAAAGTAPTADTPDEDAAWTGAGAWVFPALSLAFGAVALWGAADIQVPPGTPPPGPRVFPAVIGALLVATAAAMAAVNLYRMRAGAGGRAQRPQAPPTQWPPVLIIVVTLAAHIALLRPLGWILAGALLFWGVAYAFGARDHLRNAAAALAVSSAVQVGFSMGLGLGLPGGILEVGL